jgi:hydroxyacylglutathione hydrolase
MQYHSREISRRRQMSALLAFIFLGGAPIGAQIAAPDGGQVRGGNLPSSWNTGGPKCMEMPEWQVHEYNPDLYILRQSGCTDFEKPFVFLLFGTERALLLDSGSRASNIGAQIQLTVHRWLKRSGRSAIPLVVVHTHAHGDHVAGDLQLSALQDPSMPVEIVPATQEADQKFYRIAHWPEDYGSVDLGDRLIDAIAIPGHEAAGMALYDRQTGLLFTGDNVYPGRLYVMDLIAYQKSNQRLIRFSEGKVVTHIMGNHIEQSKTPYRDYPVGSMYQPEEHELALPRGVLLEIEAGLASMHGVPRRLVFRDFSLVPAAPPYRNTPESDAAFKKTLDGQTQHMWDQNQP